MHKQHEDQPSNTLPNLSTWHRVPVSSITAWAPVTIGEVVVMP